MKQILYSILFFTLMFNLVSCSDNDNDETIVDRAGRFDSTDFFWDYDNSLHSSAIYLGSARDIYVGAVYPKSSVESRLFDQESTQLRNSIDLIFGFDDPYTDRVEATTGSILYANALKRAINSEEYDKQQSVSPAITVVATEYYNDKDIIKALTYDKSDSGLLLYQVNNKRDTKKMKGMLISRITKNNMEVMMDFPKGGIFQDETLNSKTDYLYVQSLQYGSVAYVCIESDVEYTLLREAYLAGLSSLGSSEQNKILDDANITIVYCENYNWATLDNLDSLNKQLKSRNKEVYGKPIFASVKTLQNQ